MIMRYGSDIYELPLSVFVEIYTDADNSVEFEGDDGKEAAARVIADYMEIVGGRRLRSEISESDGRMNLVMTVECMNACECMMRLGMYGEVRGILAGMGYPLDVSDTDGMSSRISALKSRARYDLDKAERDRREERPERPTKREFINEVVAVGKYNRMHIAMNEWTAGAYACLVRQTCDEIEELNRRRR